MSSIELGYPYSIDTLNRGNIKHTVHNLSSGIVVIDVWYKDLFYVLQFENEFIGFSELSYENPGFDTVPDLKFFDFDTFKNKLDSVLK